MVTFVRQVSYVSARSVSVVAERIKQTGHGNDCLLKRGARGTSVMRSRGPPERQLSALLVGVSVAFVCLRLPYTIAYYLYAYRKEFWKDNETTETRLYTAQQITDVIATSNYVVNFFLYSLCGSYFRHQITMACG
jgi:hypothetical protein